MIFKKCFILEQYSYSAALHELPDLPKWMSLVYNPNVKLGFIYGTPPANLEQVKVRYCNYSCFFCLSYRTGNDSYCFHIDAHI